jgi:hypothetical protein
MSDDDKRPYFTDDHLAYLDRMFPDRLPELKDDERRIWFNRGTVEVIRHLKRLREEQDELIITRPTLRDATSE